MNTKTLILAVLMGALGNVLSGISIMIAPLLPSIPLGPISVKANFDLSHLTTFISALYGGAAVGGLTGLIGGSVAAYEFGFSQGNIVNVFAIPVGKALTGITAGLIMSALRLVKQRNRRNFLMLTTIVAFTPEAIWTAFIFLAVLPIVVGISAVIFYPILTVILVKAYIEMVIMGLVVAILSRNEAFNTLALSHLGTPETEKKM